MSTFTYRPTYWKPQPGEVIEGTVVRVLKQQSNFSNQPDYPVLELKTEDGLVRVNVNHGGLFKKLAAVKPQPGDVVGIRYQGRVGEGQQAPHRYEAHVAREGILLTDHEPVEEAFTWDEAPF